MQAVGHEAQAEIQVVVGIANERGRSGQQGFQVRNLIEGSFAFGQQADLDAQLQGAHPVEASVESMAQVDLCRVSNAALAVKAEEFST